MNILRRLVRLANLLDTLGRLDVADRIDEVIISIAARQQPYRLGALLIAPDGSLLLRKQEGKWEIPITDSQTEAVDAGNPAWVRESYRQAAGFVQSLLGTAPDGQALNPHVSAEDGVPLVVHLIYLSDKSKTKIDRKLGKLDMQWLSPSAVNEAPLTDEALSVLVGHDYTDQLLFTGEVGNVDKHLANMAGDKELKLQKIEEKVANKKLMTLEEANFLKNHILESNPAGVDLGNAHTQLRMEQPNRPRREDVLRMIREGRFTKATDHRGSPRYEIHIQYKDERYVLSVAFDDTKSMVVVTVFNKTQNADRPERFYGEGYDPTSGGAAHFGQG